MLFTSSPARWRTVLVGGLVASLSLIPGSSADTPDNLSGPQPPAKSQADYYVHELPGAPEPLLKMHAG